MAVKKYLFLVIKLTIALGLLVFLIGRVDLEPIADRLADIDPVFLVLAALCLLSQIPVGSLRWSIVLNIIEKRPPFWGAARLIIIGNFFNQAMPSIIAGDAARIWFLRKWGFSTGSAVKGVLVDRAIGVLGLAGLSVISLPYAFVILPNNTTMLGLTLMVCAVFGGYACLALTGTKLFGRFDHIRLIAAFRQLGIAALKLTKNIKAFCAVLALSLAIHFLLVLSFICLGHAVGAPLDLGKALVIVPPVILFSMIPVTFAGWGLRETAMVTAVTMMGGLEADAFVISVLFGLTMLALYLPGGVLWLRVKGQVQTEDVSEDPSLLDPEPQADTKEKP